ncbi:ras-related and estrogen-regulated growth inhibitor-like protein [Actinia tenebrosa]|uniref:small monomeric GTPase n=1 Tax=Actinia tenebrosa TaxID=6105 RepID=A0A6P8ISK8_ACTTE|nr:ras-related and estrogen-regulated growth inhibitor-like protein [Actinia tenebrosa]
MEYLTLPSKPTYSSSSSSEKQGIIYNAKRMRRGSNQNSKSLNVAVLGKDGVGKSAFIVRALTRRFIGEYDSKFECTYKHNIDVDGHSMSIEVLDTVGNNTLARLDNTTSHIELFFVLYSATDRSSFTEASRLIKYLSETRNIDPACVTIVATKKDLKHMKEIEEYEGRFLAQDIGCSFYQISISEGYSETLKTVQEAIRKCMSYQNMKKKGGFFDTMLRRRSWSGQL